MPWVATVEINITVTVHFNAPKCTSQFTIDAPDFGGVLLPQQPFELLVSVIEPCQFAHNLTVSDGRTFIQQELLVNEGENVVQLQFSTPGTANAEAVIQGTFSCGNDTIHINTQILTLGRIPVEITETGTLQAYGSSTIEIPIDSLGNSEQSFTVELDGPMSRIGEVENRIVLTGNDSLEVQIDPNGLLQNRMSVDGQVVLISQSGHRWSIELEYSAIDGEINTFDEWRTPGRLLGLAGLICAIWVLLGMVDINRKPKKEESHSTDGPFNLVENAESKEIDAWGRELDPS